MRPLRVELVTEFFSFLVVAGFCLVVIRSAMASGKNTSKVLR
ncbi:hypothetical protein Sarmat_00645 [Rickettsiales endosymbiont of Paramecium tredecaurelia]|nr:hypothetical protein [Candidatus Sarmatiella mevalonica]